MQNESTLTKFLSHIVNEFLEQEVLIALSGKCNVPADNQNNWQLILQRGVRSRRDVPPSKWIEIAPNVDVEMDASSAYGFNEPH